MERERTFEISENPSRLKEELGLISSESYST